MTLRIEKGGKIIFEKWNPPTKWNDEARDYEDEGFYSDEDVSLFSHWVHKKDKYVTIGEGVTLNDFFIIASGQPELMDLVCTNCFIVDYIDTWNKVKNIPAPEYKYDPDGIEYLELYWVPDYQAAWSEEHGFNSEKNGMEIGGLDRACFHGVGWELKEDKYESYQETPVWKKGDRISWGIDFCKLEELLHLPIKLNTDFVIKEDWHENKVPFNELKTLVSAKRNFTLLEAIQGVFWELSFYGGEEEKNEKASEIREMSKEIDDAIENNALETVARPISLRESLNDGYINDGMGWNNE